jgi:hypothetical protein
VRSIPNQAGINTSNLSLFSFDDSVVTVKHSMNIPSNLISTINGIKSSSHSDMDEGAALRSMMYCSRFNSCSAQKCPLDPLIDRRSEADWDPICGMAKATRHRYWESMPEDLRAILPYKGYSRAEYNRMTAARERWESLSQEQRERLKAMGRERLEKSRGARK